MNTYIVLLLAYVIGSIPSGYILSKLILKKDVRKFGSGSTGATNVMRLGNPIIGILTAICDFIKGIAIVIVVSRLCKDNMYLYYGSILTCILGHIFPVLLLFKGGKGVATMTGAIFAISFLSGIFSLIAWLFVLIKTKKSFVASLALCISFVLYQFLFVIKYDFNQHRELILFLSLLFIIILLAHTKNILNALRKN